MQNFIIITEQNALTTTQTKTFVKKNTAFIFMTGCYKFYLNNIRKLEHHIGTIYYLLHKSGYYSNKFKIDMEQK